MYDTPPRGTSTRSFRLHSRLSHLNLVIPSLDVKLLIGLKHVVSICLGQVEVDALLVDAT